MYTVNSAKTELKTGIRVYLQKDEKGKYVLKDVNRLPFFLIGAPGIGKTELTEQVARELNIGFVSFSITHHTRNTVLGLPVIDTVEKEDGDEKYTRYTMSEIIALVEQEKEKGHPEGILLIDEFACMAESLVAPMLAFLQTKNIGSHTLPEGWIMVLCSNPPEYNKTARKFDMAVMDRVRVMEITFDADEFLRYAEDKKFHSAILEYLRNHRGNIHICKKEEQGTSTIVTTRGWENLSLCLKGYEKVGGEVSEELIKQFIKSDTIAYDFYTFYTISDSGISPEQLTDILNGNNIRQNINAVASYSYKKRWNIMNILSRTLHGRCEPYWDEQEFLDYMDTVKEELERKTKTKDIDIWLYDLWDELGGRLRRIGNGDIIISAWQSREPDEREKMALREILNACPEEYKNNDFVDVEKYNPECLHCIDNYIQAEKKKLKKKHRSAGKWIENAISFIEGIEQQDNLIEPFISMLNQKKEILLVLSEAPCSNYVKHIREIYGMELREHINKKMAELC